MEFINLIKDFKSRSKLNKIFYYWTIISIIFWFLYNLLVEYLSQSFYYLVIAFTGFLMFKYNKKLNFIISKIKLNYYAKFILLGIFMVLFEEIFAAFFNHLSEGFSFNLLLIRIFQFQFFNVLAFIGPIIALAILFKKYKFSYDEMLYLILIYIIFAENLYINLMTLIFLPTITAIIYFIIFYPAILCIKKTNQKQINIYYKFLIGILLIIIFLIIPSIILDYLRLNFPYLFPPVKFIPL